MRLHFYQKGNKTHSVNVPSTTAKFASLRKLRNGNTKEVVSKINGLDCLSPITVNSWCDCVAGIGFSPSYAVYKNPNVQLLLNDLSDEFYDNLIKQFPGASVHRVDVFSDDFIKLVKRAAPEVTFLDLDHFTLNQPTELLLLLNILPYTNVLLLTGVYSFSLLPWELSRFQAYVLKLNKWLRLRNKQVEKVFIYKNRKVEIFKIIEFTKEKEPVYIFEEYMQNPFTLTIQKNDAMSLF